MSRMPDLYFTLYQSFSPLKWEEGVAEQSWHQELMAFHILEDKVPCISAKQEAESLQRSVYNPRRLAPTVAYSYATSSKGPIALQNTTTRQGRGFKLQACGDCISLLSYCRDTLYISSQASREQSRGDPSPWEPMPSETVAKGSSREQGVLPWLPFSFSLGPQPREWCHSFTGHISP